MTWVAKCKRFSLLNRPTKLLAIVLMQDKTRLVACLVLCYDGSQYWLEKLWTYTRVQGCAPEKSWQGHVWMGEYGCYWFSQVYNHLFKWRARWV
jgi:hypothetical protein